MNPSASKGKFESQVFPWAKHLSPDDRAEFANELVPAFVEAVQTKKWSGLDEIIDSWKATMGAVNSRQSDREYAEVE